MTDTLISPSGSKRWEVWEKIGKNTIGHIDQDQKTNTFKIEAASGSILAGIDVGPYSSKADAMDAIADFTDGSCDMYSHHAM